MMHNMGNLDRILRLIVVAAIATAWWIGKLSGVLAIIFGVVAVVFLVTSLIGTCPLYMLYGASTRRKG